MLSRSSLNLSRRMAPRFTAVWRNKFLNYSSFGRRSAGVVSGVAVGTLLGGAAVAMCWGGDKVAEPPFDLKSVRRDIEELISNNMPLGPMFVRLAWHEAGSWDCQKKDGAANSASMRFRPECDYGGNKGLEVARDALEPLKRKYPAISYADLWVLAAYTAIEYMGGPTIPFRWGRSDAKDGSVCGPDGRLPDGSKTQDHVREVFTRLGFNDQETVALIGAHTCGECRLENSGFKGPWTHDKYGFDNAFFMALLAEEWEMNPEISNLQFMDRETGNLMMLPADVALVLDPNYKKHVDIYAKDNDLFNKDFATAFQKLTELGTSNLFDVPSNK